MFRLLFRWRGPSPARQAPDVFIRGLRSPRRLADVAARFSVKPTLYGLNAQSHGINQGSAHRERGVVLRLQETVAVPVGAPENNRSRHPDGGRRFPAFWKKCGADHRLRRWIWVSGRRVLPTTGRNARVCAVTEWCRAVPGFRLNAQASRKSWPFRTVNRPSDRTIRRSCANGATRRPLFEPTHTECRCDRSGSGGPVRFQTFEPTKSPAACAAGSVAIFAAVRRGSRRRGRRYIRFRWLCRYCPLWRGSGSRPSRR